MQEQELGKKASGVECAVSSSFSSHCSILSIRLFCQHVRLDTTCQLIFGPKDLLQCFIALHLLV